MSTEIQVIFTKRLFYVVNFKKYGDGKTCHAATFVISLSISLFI